MRELPLVSDPLFRRIPWFPLGMTGIFIFSLFLRFWKLTQFNTLVFDEVYYAKYANDYLIGVPFFQSHPPLSQYLIAFGIWFGSHFPASPDTMNDLTGSMRSTFSYRWLNAFTGSFVPLIVGAIAYQLSDRRSYAFIAALFIALDGLFLVESRYALNNIYLILFGLLGQLCFLLAIKNQRYQNLKLILCGIFLGCTASIKWNGLGFWLGIYFVLGFIFIVKLATYWILFILDLIFITKSSQNRNNQFTLKLSRRINLRLKRLRIVEKKITRVYLKLKRIGAENSIFSNFLSLGFLRLFLALFIIPILTYVLLWIPHLIINPQYNFWQVHREIYSFHHRIGGNSPDVHPYCSPWFTWLILWRPVAYFFESKVINGKNVIYDVHSMGNPILWWLSFAAILIIFALFLQQILYKKNELYNPSLFIYIILNYFVNLLPWLNISRCTFLYHYMASYTFTVLSLAWLVDQWINKQTSFEKRTGIIIVTLVVLAFIHWLPIYLGLPLSDWGFKIRMFPNWI